jgi:hypothetical protein
MKTKTNAIALLSATLLLSACSDDQPSVNDICSDDELSVECLQGRLNEQQQVILQQQQVLTQQPQQIQQAQQEAAQTPPNYQQAPQQPVVVQVPQHDSTMQDMMLGGLLGHALAGDGGRSNSTIVNKTIINKAPATIRPPAPVVRSNIKPIPQFRQATSSPRSFSSSRRR